MTLCSHPGLPKSGLQVTHSDWPANWPEAGGEGGIRCRPVPDFPLNALEVVPKVGERSSFWTGESKVESATGDRQRTLKLSSSSLRFRTATRTASGTRSLSSCSRLAYRWSASQCCSGHSRKSRAQLCLESNALYAGTNEHPDRVRAVPQQVSRRQIHGSRHAIRLLLISLVVRKSAESVCAIRHACPRKMRSLAQAASPKRVGMACRSLEA